MRKFTKKRIALGALGVLAAVGIAAAYFTTTGSGEGSAEVGTSSALTITAEVPTKLYPGTTSKVKFKVDNPSKGHQYVTTVTLMGVEAFEEPDHETLIPGCQSSWFKMPAVSAAQDVPGQAETTLTQEGTLEFENKAESQDACKNAYLLANFTSN